MVRQVLARLTVSVNRPTPFRHQHRLPCSDLSEDESGRTGERAETTGEHDHDDGRHHGAVGLTTNNGSIGA